MTGCSGDNFIWDYAAVTCKKGDDGECANPACEEELEWDMDGSDAVKQLETGCDYSDYSEFAMDLYPLASRAEDKFFWEQMAA